MSIDLFCFFLGGGFLAGSFVLPQVASAFSSPCLGLDVVLLDEEQNVMEGEGEGELAVLPPSIGLSTFLLNGDHQIVYFEGMPMYKGMQLRRHGDQMKRLGGHGKEKHEGRESEREGEK